MYLFAILLCVWASQVKLKEGSKWCQWVMLWVAGSSQGCGMVACPWELQDWGGKDKHQPRREEGEVHLVEPGEALERTGRKSKSKLGPVLAPAWAQGQWGPEAIGVKRKFIIPDASPRNTGLARALIPILQRSQLRHTAKIPWIQVRGDFFLI